MGTKFIGIIPARYQSTRFPGKPLAVIKGKPMIQWVYENTLKTLGQAWVATDDDRIFSVVERFGGKAVRTSPEHQSGTDRCAEAAELIANDTSFDVVINVQGDEPFIKAAQIELLKNCFVDRAVNIATLVKKIDSADELNNPNRPKVVLDNKKNALYFSRAAIPYFRNEAAQDWHLKHRYWAHIGLYAFRFETLRELTRLKQTPLELAESLEQLRWLENGYSIRTAETTFQSIGIDTPEDLEAALQLF